MTIDLTGGIELSVDEMRLDPPPSPTFREGAAMFVWDDAGRFAVPRAMVEAVGATWDSARGVLLYVGEPGGRLLACRQEAPPHPVLDGRGRPRVLGGGPMRFECLEPFARWRLTFDGTAQEVDARDGAAAAGSEVPVGLAVEARMTAPPWVQGSRDPEGHFNPGEHRFEQHFRATGTLAIDGTETAFTGGGLRIHRTGGSRGTGEDFYGHVWQTARFPSGRAFGFMHYHPRPDGTERYREGWVLDRGGIVPARPAEVAWMTGVQPDGEDVSLTLRAPSGDVRIEAETVVSWYRPEKPQPGRATTFPTLHSGIARYRWDGEEAFGMIERSAVR
ncbi:MAG TPA: hypothetical protein VFI47_21505 [Acidimicrobiales bacterium]|nr:hypothetical protein [Acidimicrobiales bacterium]